MSRELKATEAALVRETLLGTGKRSMVASVWLKSPAIIVLGSTGELVKAWTS